MPDSEVLGGAGSTPGLAQGAVIIDLHAARTRADGAAAPSTASMDVGIGDWDLLFSAVKARLRRAIEQAAASEVQSPAAHSQIEAEVLRCVGALDQLHATMLHHLEQGCVIETAFAATQSEMAALRDELAGSHADERAARHSASHDDLTALPNGAGFRARLAAVTAAATQGRSFAVFYVDLDGFKAINDAHGHATGDHLLRIVAARLAGEVRAEDMVSRMGGDEFACLLWAGSPGREALTRLAKSLFDTVSAPLQIGSLSLHVRPSIGIAVWPGDGATAEQLLASADVAMVHAKRQQSGHVFFDEAAAR